MDDLLQDVNIALPIQRFLELEQAGDIGALAPSHYSFMEFQGFPGDITSQADQRRAEGQRPGQHTWRRGENEDFRRPADPETPGGGPHRS